MIKCWFSWVTYSSYNTNYLESYGLFHFDRPCTRHYRCKKLCCNKMFRLRRFFKWGIMNVTCSHLKNFLKQPQLWHIKFSKLMNPKNVAFSGILTIRKRTTLIYLGSKMEGLQLKPCGYFFYFYPVHIMDWRWSETILLNKKIHHTLNLLFSSFTTKSFF